MIIIILFIFILINELLMGNCLNSFGKEVVYIIPETKIEADITEKSLSFDSESSEDEDLQKLNSKNDK